MGKHEFRVCNYSGMENVWLQKKSWSHSAGDPDTLSHNLKKRLWQHSFIMLRAAALVFICSLILFWSCEPWVILTLLFVLEDSVTVSPL